MLDYGFGGFKWIKVKRHAYDSSKTWEENYKALDEHHVEECNFLIAKVRELGETLRNHQEHAMERDERTS